MVSVASLLNPLPTSHSNDDGRTSAEVQSQTFQSRSSTPRALPKYKMSKTAAIFTKGRAKGAINYKPHETQDEKIAAEHWKFKLEPKERIGDYPRHIPYSSDKKSFQKKTGRDAFEAYQYTFRMPGDDPRKDAHALMWDYNVGLVRITALFKSLNHSKTMPAKVMASNPGLREISHSITGGSISAQGYWVPFEAAKAIAATFCWEIRYALTPVFGLDFPNSCTAPHDPAFMCLKIDPAIIDRCEREACISRAQPQEASLPAVPRTPTDSDGGPRRLPKLLRPKTTDIESGYGTDSDRSAVGSPTSTSSHRWTPVTIPRSVQQPYPSPAQTLLSTPPPSSTTLEREARKKKTSGKRESANNDYLSGITKTETPAACKRQKTSQMMDNQQLTQEALAAMTLMELHRADSTMAQRVRAMSRRASS